LFAVEVSHYTQYFGIASYASKIALNRLDASHVLVSYTSDVEPWDGVDTLMVDSGGYSLVNTDRTEYQTSDEEYLDYIQEYSAEYAMLRDYPLGSDPDTTVPELQQRTTEHQRRLVDRWDISTTPVAVVQGRTPRQYLNHVSQLRDASILERLLVKIDEIEETLGMSSDVLGLVLEGVNLEDQITAAIAKDDQPDSVADDLESLVENKEEAARRVDEELLIRGKFDLSEEDRDIREIVDKSAEDTVSEADVERVDRFGPHHRVPHQRDHDVRT
jgi:hypothetical protein